MRRSKEKAVISADPEQLAEVRGLIRARRYKSVSEFVRVAIDEKLERLKSDRLAAQVERYCSDDEHIGDIIEAQAFGSRRRHAKR